MTWFLGVTAIVVAMVVWLRVEALLRELRGKSDAIIAAKQSQADESGKERDAYRDLANQWRAHLESIQSSLTRNDREALTAVSGMQESLKPIVSIFRSPQAAGIEFGEAQLEMILQRHLGEGLFTKKPQHLAVGQEAVDFTVVLPDCVVPIDSKFPAAKYRSWVEAEEGAAKGAWREFRDALLRQLEVTAKYIKPDAGTTDYALLFLPSDIIYQQAFLTSRLYDQPNPIPARCQELQVFGCSPQTLLPLFGVIRLGLRNLRISEDAQAVRRHMDELVKVFRTYEGDWGILRGHLERLARHVDKMESGREGLQRVKGVIERLAGSRPGEGTSTEAPPAITTEPQALATNPGAWHD